jgi:N-acetylmuramoyl-L-alanine amidase
MPAKLRHIGFRIFATILAIQCLVSPAAAALIAIDIGHSQSAQGSQSATGYGEYLYNRSLALEVARVLRAYGHQVDLPNANGTIKSLGARPARAAAIKADLFVSIHHDSIQPHLMPRREQYRGYSVWTSGSHPQARSSFACASKIAATMKGAGMTPALFHADKIPGESHLLLDHSTGVYRRDGLAVLRLSKTPAVLIEAGVIVNPVEEAWLNTPNVRSAIARTIARGIVSCVQQIRTR